MQNRSPLWKTLAASGAAKLEAKAVIDGAEYAEILNPVVNRAMCPDALSLGNCVSAALQFSVRPDAGTPVSEGAEVTLKIRFTDGVRTSEWMEAGTFYANRRMTDPVTGTVSFQCFDAMRKADAPYPVLSGFPKAMNSAVMEIARNIGVEADRRTWDNVPTGGDCYVTLPANGAKMIKVLGYIGGVCGGNWIITPHNRLRLVPFASASDALNADDSARIIGVTGRIATCESLTVTGVSASSGAGSFFAGSDTGAVIRVESNPYMTQTAVNALLSKYAGLSYVPYAVEKGLYDPALEMGDYLISRTNIQSVICQENAYYAPAFRGDLSAPESADNGQSVSDAIAQWESAAQDLSVRIYRFANQSAVTVSDGQSAEIINFDYAAGSGQDVIFHAEIRHTTVTTETGNASDGWTCTDAVLTVTYYINGAAVTSYHPVKTETDGANLLHLTYHFANRQFNAGNFRVALALSGGSVTIAAGDAIAYIIGQGYSGIDDNWIAEDGLVFVGVENYPNKLNYITGDTLDLTGLVMKAYYADGTDEDITSECIFDPADGDALEEGETVVGISYTEDSVEFRDSFSVYCSANHVIYIEIVSPPTKTEYFPGETLDLTGIAVSAFYEDGTEADVTGDCAYTPADGATLTGEETITASAAFTPEADGETFAAYFDVHVKSIRITAYPYKSDYFVGDTLDYTGLEVTEAVSDGAWNDITDECVITPAEGTEVTEPGDIMIDVQHDGKSLGTFWVAATVAIIASGDGWTLYDNGKLDIDTNQSGVPWADYKNQITSVEIRDGITYIGSYAFSYCTDLTSVTIPDSVTYIGPYAFNHCVNLTSVTIPDSVTGIGAGAFNGCAALTGIGIPNGITYIGETAFSGCVSLTSITIPTGVTRVLHTTFKGCTSLTSVTLSDRVTRIEESAFRGCTSLASVTIPDGVTYIGKEAFYSCTSLTSITIPNGVIGIWDETFYNCANLTSVVIPNSVTQIGTRAFRDCTNLASVTIPGSVTEIKNDTFSGCATLTSVTIPHGVTSIKEYAFYSCIRLTSVVIPDSVTNIYNNAFYRCNALMHIYYSGTQAQWNTVSIGNYNTALTNATIHYNSTGP